jgi:benzil reductase ((S)-benzoin forming)
MHLTIITGASRGLGRAVAQELLARGHHVLALSRRPVDLDVPAGAALTHWAVDLADASPVAARLSAWLAAQTTGPLATATLINNAGVVSQLAPLSEVDAADLTQALRVGLEAPMLLTAAFLKATAVWRARRKVLLVSSGLGRRGMAGSASYCAAKAGMDNLARALALEETAKANGAAVVSLAPGVIDTDMQLQLRAADRKLFPQGAAFADMKTGGQLDSADLAASKLLRYLDRADFGSQPVADVRDV